MNKNIAIVTLNAGSSSMKFGLYLVAGKNLNCAAQGGIFDLDNQTVFKLHNEKEAHALPHIKDHQQASTYLLNWLGLEIDRTANTENITQLCPPDSKVSVWCIPTDEELMIARHTRALLQGHTI